jgi:hypothetical protein
LVVTYDGRILDSPHLLTVRLRNNGPADLTPSSFEGGALQVLCSPVLEGIVDYDTPLEPSIIKEAQKSLLTIRPMLLKRGREVAVSAITSGPFKATVQSRLGGFIIRSGDDFGPIGEIIMWVIVVLLVLAMYGFGGWMIARAWIDHELAGLVGGVLLLGLAGVSTRNVFFGLVRRFRG